MYAEPHGAGDTRPKGHMKMEPRIGGCTLPPVVRPLPARSLGDLNEHMVCNGGRTGWADGALDAANLAGEMYNQSSGHPYDLTDCILGKLNLLKKGKRIRKNPYRSNPMVDGAAGEQAKKEQGT